MPKFDVCITRELSEQFICEVEADTASEAQDIANGLSEASGASWETTDWVGGTSFHVTEVNSMASQATKYISFITADLSATKVLLETYAATHIRSKDESDDDYLKRCAEQDFYDGPDGCLFPHFFHTSCALLPITGMHSNTNTKEF